MRMIGKLAIERGFGRCYGSALAHPLRLVASDQSAFYCIYQKNGSITAECTLYLWYADQHSSPAAFPKERIGVEDAKNQPFRVCALAFERVVTYNHRSPDSLQWADSTIVARSRRCGE